MVRRAARLGGKASASQRLRGVAEHVVQLSVVDGAVLHSRNAVTVPVPATQWVKRVALGLCLRELRVVVAASLGELTGLVDRLGSADREVHDLVGVAERVDEGLKLVHGDTGLVD